MGTVLLSTVLLESHRNCKRLNKGNFPLKSIKQDNVGATLI